MGGHCRVDVGKLDVKKVEAIFIGSPGGALDQGGEEVLEGITGGGMASGACAHFLPEHRTDPQVRGQHSRARAKETLSICFRMGVGV